MTHDRAEEILRRIVAAEREEGRGAGFLWVQERSTLAELQEIEGLGDEDFTPEWLDEALTAAGSKSDDFNDGFLEALEEAWRLTQEAMLSGADRSWAEPRARPLIEERRRDSPCREWSASGSSRRPGGSPRDLQEEPVRLLLSDEDRYLHQSCGSFLSVKTG